jgi:hypothetical protein
MQVRLETRVEVDGATFWFGATDRTLAPLLVLFRAHREETGQDRIDEGQLPPHLLAPACALFVEGVRRWEGVMDAEGRPLECTAASVGDFPTLQKIQVAAAYLNTWAALQGNGSGSGERGTTPTRPGPTSGS